MTGVGGSGLSCILIFSSLFATSSVCAVDGSGNDADSAVLAVGVGGPTVCTGLGEMAGGIEAMTGAAGSTGGGVGAAVGGGAGTGAAAAL